MTRNLIWLAVAAAFSAHSQDTQHDKHTDSLERIVVIAPMHSPLDIKTDPKAPRQPLPAQDGADLLSSIAGFSLIKKGGASSDPVFRGMAGSRLNIITDGGLTLGGCGGRMDPPTAYITPQTYDTLTVIKGPQTVLYGPGNSAATVIFERESERMSETGWQGFANATSGSFGKRMVNADIKGGTQDYYARVAASKSDADDYEDGEGKSIHSAYDKWNLDSEFAYTPDDDSLYSLSLGRSDGEVAYADRMMDGSKFDRSHVALNVELSELTGLVTALEANVYYNNIDHIMDNHSLRTFTPNMMMKSPTSSNPDRRTWGGKIMLTSVINKQHTLSYGVDHQQNRHRIRVSMNQPEMPVESMPRRNNAEFKQTGLFGELEYALRTEGSIRSQWVSGLRLDDWSATDKRQQLGSMMMPMVNPTANHTRNDSLWSGFTRYQVQHQDMSYYIGAGHSERFADYWELMGGGRRSVDSMSAFLLETEKTNQLDIGWMLQKSGMTTSVSLFYNRIEDYLLTDNRYEVMDKTLAVTRNIDAQTMGLEMETRMELSKRLNFTTSINYVRGSNKTDHTALAQQPPLQARLAMDYTLDKWQVGGLWRLVKSQNRVAIGQGNIAGQDVGASHGFGTLALNVSYSYSDEMLLSLGVDNVLDKTYAEHLSRAGAMVSGYAQIDKVNEAGRTLWANVNWRF